MVMTGWLRLCGLTTAWVKGLYLELEVGLWHSLQGKGYHRCRQKEQAFWRLGLGLLWLWLPHVLVLYDQLEASLPF